jgi:hypothetical protein
MAESYINYDKHPLEVYEDALFSVYDPWQAQILGTFQYRADAEMFMKAIYKREKKAALKADKWPKK